MFKHLLSFREFRINVGGSEARAHPHAAGPTRQQALGRCQGGGSTQVHRIMDAHGHPLDFVLTPGQTHERLMAAVWLNGGKADDVLGDRARSLGIPRTPWTSPGMRPAPSSFRMGMESQIDNYPLITIGINFNINILIIVARVLLVEDTGRSGTPAWSAPPWRSNDGKSIADTRGSTSPSGTWAWPGSAASSPGGAAV